MLPGVLPWRYCIAHLWEPATGIAMTMDSFWGIEWVEDVHEASAILTLFLVGFHIAGVIVSSLLCTVKIWYVQ